MRFLAEIYARIFLLSISWLTYRRTASTRSILIDGAHPQVLLAGRLLEIVSKEVAMAERVELIGGELVRDPFLQVRVSKRTIELVCQ
jgi:hypothetical protein